MYWYTFSTIIRTCIRKIDCQVSESYSCLIHIRSYCLVKFCLTFSNFESYRCLICIYCTVHEYNIFIMVPSAKLCTTSIQRLKSPSIGSDFTDHIATPGLITTVHLLHVAQYISIALLFHSKNNLFCIVSFKTRKTLHIQ